MLKSQRLETMKVYFLLTLRIHGRQAMMLCSLWSHRDTGWWSRRLKCFHSKPQRREKDLATTCQHLITWAWKWHIPLLLPSPWPELAIWFFLQKRLMGTTLPCIQKAGSWTYWVNSSGVATQRTHLTSKQCLMKPIRENTLRLLEWKYQTLKH